MADGNDNETHHTGSLELISKAWSSLTSNEPPSEATESENDSSLNEGKTEEIIDNSTSQINEVDDQEEEPRRGSIFSSIFSSFSSTDKSEDISGERTNDTNNVNENDRSEEDTPPQDKDDSTSRERNSSFISDFFSSFTSSSPETKEEVKSDNQNDHSDNKTTEDDDFDDKASVSHNDKDDDHFQQRVRSSSTALYTEPEKIDKEDLDLVTFVSS